MFYTKIDLGLFRGLELLEDLRNYRNRLIHDMGGPHEGDIPFQALHRILFNDMDVIKAYVMTWVDDWKQSFNLKIAE